MLTTLKTLGIDYYRRAKSNEIGTTMVFSIRPGESEADRPFIERLNARLVEVIKAPTHTEHEVKIFQEGFTASSWDPNIPHNATFVAIDAQGEQIGYVNVREGVDEIVSGKCAYIALLAVVPAAEGKGVAQSLVNEAEQWARQMGYVRVALDVFASNERGLRFYGKMGFNPETIRVIKNI